MHAGIAAQGPFAWLCLNWIFGTWKLLIFKLCNKPKYLVMYLAHFLVLLPCFFCFCLYTSLLSGHCLDYGIHTSGTLEDGSHCSIHYRRLCVSCLPHFLIVSRNSIAAGKDCLFVELTLVYRFLPVTHQEIPVL